MKTDVIKKVLEHNLSLGPDEPILWPALSAPTGAGKTWSVRELAKSMKLKKVTLLLATMMPEDVGGLPRVEDGITHWALPEWMQTKEPILLFMDEFDKARPETIASVLTLLAERRLRDVPLPAGSAIVLGMQPISPTEFLSDEVGRALSARVVWQAEGYDWKWAEGKFFAEGLRELMPDEKIPEMPILPHPSIRQVEWCLRFVRAHPTDKALNKDVLEGIVPIQFVAPLIDIALTDISTLSPESVVNLLTKKPEVLDKLSMVEINAVSFALWQNAPPKLIAHMYERILVECSPDEATMIHQGAVEKIYAKSKEQDNKIQLGGTCTEKQMIAAFEAMVIRVAEVYKARGEAKKAADKEEKST